MNSPEDRSFDDVGVSLVVGNEASHNDEHGNCLSDGTDEVELSSSSAVNERERYTGGKGVDSRKYGSEDKRKFSFESEIFFKDGSTGRDREHG